MLLIYLDNEVTENQDLNMDLLDVHNALFSPLRRTKHERVSNAVTESVGSGVRVAWIQILAHATNSERNAKSHWYTCPCLEDSAMLYVMSPGMSFRHWGYFLPALSPFFQIHM